MATLEQIATEAGVSKRTVINILNGRNKESWPSTARRADEVRQIAERLNYRPNAAARAVATGRFGNIGILLSEQRGRSALFNAAWDAIRAEMRERNLHLTIGDLPDKKLTSEGHIPKILSELSVDGLLIDYIADIPPRMVKLIHRYKVPSIWMNAKLENDCVHPDDFDAARRATEYLLAMGHERIAYVNYAPSNHYSATDRREGYREAMWSSGYEPLLIEETVEPPHREWQMLSEKLLSRPDRPTAVLTYEADRAYPIYCAALKLGLQVPRDLSLMTFSEGVASAVGVRLTTLQIPASDIGHEAVNILMEKIEQPSKVVPARALPFKLIEGMSCASPGSAGGSS